MLPAHLADNIRKQVLFYLQSTFTFRDRSVERSFSRFLEDPESGIFKGPWIQLRRPFRPAKADATIPFDIAKPFHPFKHQHLAWLRLTSKDHKPEPTLVTTGTGSGKTECFMVPILDHCLRMKQQGQKGIKAIVLYPMNALASDQEKRFAKAVWKDPLLRKAGVRVGNYTGRYDPANPGAAKESGTKTMGKACGISNHDAQQEEPPDILLTNYKMLDFLLMRPQDQRLWRFNEPDVLRYLVLDELHTYDGAQGSDVACLIRRLKERLGLAKGELCVVGTSATLEDSGPAREKKEKREDGSADAGEKGSDRLARFASMLFEEEITHESVIEEDRLEVEEIVSTEALELELPAPADCIARNDEDARGYSLRQAALWGAPITEAVAGETDDEREARITQWTLDLGTWLKRTRLFRYLLDIFRNAEIRREEPVSWHDLLEALRRDELALNALGSHTEQQAVVTSFVALVAHAQELRSGTPFPLVPTQVQLWIRELRRLGRMVDDSPVFAWLDEPIPGRTQLPAFQCSECGDSGWVALADMSTETQVQAQGVNGVKLESDPSKIYQAWFGHAGMRDKNIRVISPWDEVKDGVPGETEAATQQELTLTQDYICPTSLVLRKGDGGCPLTGDPKRFRVKVSADTRSTDNSGVIGDQGCPCCGSKVGVFFIGSQAATLASVAIDELFGSVLNNDPKLLAFTDSVQDASHRAGFFTARTYHFTFRTALRHVLDDVDGGGLPLPEAGHALLEYWGRAGRLGNVREAMCSVMPPDLQSYGPFVEFRNSETEKMPSSELRRSVEQRLTWEVTSEFGLMKTHGRTMEMSGSACVGWDEAIIDRTVVALIDSLPGVSSTLVGLEKRAVRLWIYGMLHRYRERGALTHPYINSLAKNNFWGKFPFGRAMEGRETFPPRGHYIPQLMVTHKKRGHQHVLSTTTGSHSPWHILWARRVFQLPGTTEAELLDLIHAWLKVGTKTGLLVKLHQDGDAGFYGISSKAACLYADGVHLVCSETEKPLVRPAVEAEVWKDGPSVEYYGPHGRYRPEPFSPRQEYYRERYRRGALRRVVAAEHTGLLQTDEREDLERHFSEGKHEDDPNVITCTSTLEMGIDIGDLSSTMLCSIPPTTASYLQRIGRAGRATGTALIVSIVNQTPHDLFFFARPSEMLKGQVDPPGCWLDAAAVLGRQYLAYCLDTATHHGKLKELPATGRQLVDDLNNPSGHLPGMLEWMTLEEDQLRDRFLKRFYGHLREDTRERFMVETQAETIRQLMHQAVNEYNQMRLDLANSRKRLSEQLAKLGEDEEEARREGEQELRILTARLTSASRVQALEVLTDHGLLPNYAFPERGVRFYGAVYNKHQRKKQDFKPIELSRPAGTALREIAPRNSFYTHSRQFDVQQIMVGNQQFPLIEQWAICGVCGHMRRVEELERPDSLAACPQCGHDGDDCSQTEKGQQRAFICYPKSQALSYMEHYDSQSGDRSDERQQVAYQIVRSFDQTINAPTGAVGEDSLPFGIEYRSAMVLREVNAGFAEQRGEVPFGPDTKTPEVGFLVCADCGVVAGASEPPGDVRHRRSCRGRKKNEKLEQEGRKGTPIKWEKLYLYRELRSEAVRLLLPITDDEDVDTLRACIYLGLRLQFEGNPGHLIVAPQILPDAGTGLEKHYLVLMDAVPGGTGYLKSLYQSEDETGRKGEGILGVLRLALNALETCSCRKHKEGDRQHDPDGCYRCIRTFHLRYNADRISRERGIRLLSELIKAGEKRKEKASLDEIKTSALKTTVLEKKFIGAIADFVVDVGGTWESTIIKGNPGFRFILPSADRIWEIEQQPLLGAAQGVLKPSQPDFVIRCDDEDILPVAVFTDGFEFHCYPHNRIADDLEKRRAIVASGRYLVWSITWDDITTDQPDFGMVCHHSLVQYLEKYARQAKTGGASVPEGRAIIRNGLEQLKAFIACPSHDGWQRLAAFAAYFPLQMLMERQKVDPVTLNEAITAWSTGNGLADVSTSENGSLVYNGRAGLGGDVIATIPVDSLISNRRQDVTVLSRLGDSDAEVSGSEYKERWRRFLACMNLYQFLGGFRFWACSEADAQDVTSPMTHAGDLTDEWQAVLEDVTLSVRPLVTALAEGGAVVPKVEHFGVEIDDEAFAELAWPEATPPVALLVDDQETFAQHWQQCGWRVVSLQDIQAKGVEWLVKELL